MILDDFFVRALVAGFGVAVVAGPFGCFVVWRRMAYVGDTMAHSALLGIALGFLLGVDPRFGVTAVVVAVALLLVGLGRSRRLPLDTLLGILAHASLALGLVVLAMMAWLRVDLFAYLFGDILAISGADIAVIYGGGAVALFGLAVAWRPLLASTVDADVARAEGMPVVFAHLAFMLLLALVVAVSMRVVGVLLITSLLVIPPAAARRLAATPEGMAVVAAGVGLVSVAGGLSASLYLDVPSGPAVVVAAAFLFAVSLLPGPRSRRIG